MYKYAVTEPSSHYFSNFKEENIKIKPGLHRGDKNPEGMQHAACDCRGLWIIFNRIKSAVPTDRIATAKAVLGKVVEMDRTARSVVKAEGIYEEDLGYIVITEGYVEFRYAPRKVNTEWGVHFKKNEEGVWVYDDWG